jgi:DNA helicase-2/ATP-dependent DNA helicase PcrA
MIKTYNDLIIIRDKLKQDLIEEQQKIFQIENNIINIERELSKFSQKIIIENLELSIKQNEIVKAPINENILVVACPGSGKTHTLISRYINIILNTEYNINPEEILLITFTKKAGTEMYDRLTKYLPNSDMKPYHVGSLHSLSYKVLQEFNDINYTIMDENETKEYIRDIISKDNIINNMNNDDINIIRSKINSIIDFASTEYPFNLSNAIVKFNMEKYIDKINHIYNIYSIKKKKENIIDFNDMMIMFSQFLESKKSIPFKNKIKYIFFDEYQDINPIQNYILSILSKKSKYMVVGDDAQSIYSFRGSSVKYILNFNQEKKKNSKQCYLLEENYRSTEMIVNFCQNIISRNNNQYQKNVIAKNTNIGMKPNILGFKKREEQYLWIIDDIKNKIAEGVSLSDMVILARKNNSLNDIEIHLLANKISISKHIGLSILDKPHVKDFLAFIIIILNPKSSIHWKRLLTLISNVAIANNIIDSNDNILYSISINNNDNIKELYNTMQKINNKTIKDSIKVKYVLLFLESYWMKKGLKEFTEMMDDINILLSFMKNLTLEKFISELYLDQVFENNLTNVLYMTTVHSAKGLEWDYVYIIDMDSNNFPLLKRNKYYSDELDDIEEERRLFYVASSRAKKCLNITYHYSVESINVCYSDTTVVPSPFLRELDCTLYNSCGVSIERFKPTLNINKDIYNYLKYIGYDKISKDLNKIENSKCIINNTMILDKCIKLDNYDRIVDTFIKYLIMKMIQVNFPEQVKKFSINSNKKVSNKIYLEYNDIQTDWRNILEYIFIITTCNLSENIDISTYKTILINDNIYAYYIEMEKSICKLINMIQPKNISINYTISHSSVSCCIDVLCDNTIILIKSSINEIVTVPLLLEQLMNSYILKKKDYIIDNIIMFNPITNTVNNININKIDILKFKKNIYN